MNPASCLYPPIPFPHTTIKIRQEKRGWFCFHFLVLAFIGHLEREGNLWVSIQTEQKLESFTVTSRVYCIPQFGNIVFMQKQQANRKLEGKDPIDNRPSTD